MVFFLQDVMPPHHPGAQGGHSQGLVHQTSGSGMSAASFPEGASALMRSDSGPKPRPQQGHGQGQPDLQGHGALSDLLGLENELTSIQVHICYSVVFLSLQSLG